MKRLSALFLIFASAVAPGAALADCPVTLPSSSPVDVPGSGPGGVRAWYGSEALAVWLPADGRWKGMGPSHRFRDKFWIWRRGYDAESEPRPAMTLAGVKLDGGGTPERLQINRVTNAFGPGWSQMLTMMEFPSAGCWQVTAKYVYEGITQDLTFVVDVVAE
jgi:hypothetical protein